MNLWDEVLDKMRADIPDDDFRRFFGATAYASDSGDQLTVWVTTEPIRRHIATHYERAIERVLEALGRSNTQLRLVVSGTDEDEEDDE
jgi:chromosomal replication initiation ATPase DnaA